MTRIQIPLVAAVGAMAALAPVAVAARGVRRSVGVRPQPQDFPGSPQFRDGGFHNRLPMTIIEAADQGSLARDFATKGDRGRPSGPVPLAHPDLPGVAASCAATWLGHASVLLEIDGHWVLTDPVWSERVSPSTRVGPHRLHPVPLSQAELPRLDAVLISHDHYDHLDTATVDALTRDQEMPFVVPLGIGGHLRRWGVPAERIIELDWDQSRSVGDLDFTCTEARHFSGRLFTRNTTLWSSWVVGSGDRKVFFGGDSGYTPAFGQIGRQHGPFDLTVLPIGAYDRRWPDVHMNPAEAVRTHLDLDGAVLLPIHWATFDLAFHTWSAPVEWLRAEAASSNVRLALPRPGGRFEVDATLPTADWWSASV